MFKNRFLLVLSPLSLILVAMAVALPPASADTNRAIQRGREAYAARWTGLSERAIDEAERQRSRDADAARWEGMAEHYQNVEEAQNLERGRDADADCWTALAEHYTQAFGK